VTRFISHCDEVDEGRVQGRGAGPMKYMADGRWAETQGLVRD
jgi:hypothetical protein